MERNRLVDLQDMASDLRLNMDALKALATVFGDAYCTEGDTERLARNIANRPDVYVHLWYILFGMVCDLSKAAHELDDALGAE